MLCQRNSVQDRARCRAAFLPPSRVTPMLCPEKCDQMQKGLDTILRHAALDRHVRAKGATGRVRWRRTRCNTQIDVTTRPGASDQRSPILVAPEMTMLYRCMTHSSSF